MTDWDSLVDSALGGASPPPQGAPQTSAAPTDWDAATNSAFAPIPVGTDKYVEPMRGTVPSLWGTQSNFVDSILLGYGKNLAAYAPTASDVMSGKAPEPKGRLAELTAAQEAYRKASPRESLLSEIGGGALGTIPAMWAGQEYAAAPLAARLATALPRLGAPAMDFLGGAAGAYGQGLGPAVLRSGSTAARGALEGAESGLLQSHMGTEDTSTQAEKGALVGAVANPLLAPIAARLSSTITPTTAEATRSAIAQGVPIRAGQLPGVSPLISTLDKVMSGAKDAPERAAFYRALSTKAGVPSDHIDQAWVQAADSLNGGTMQRIASTYHLDPTDPQLNADLAHLDAHAQGQLSIDGHAKYQQLRDKIEAELAGGPVPGSVYQAWTQKGGLLDNFSKDKELKPLISMPGGLRDVLDSGWENSIQNSGRPNAATDYDAWRTARSQYKVTRAIDEDVDEKTGDYNPQNLLKRIQARYGSARKAGDLGDLGTAGQYIYKPDKPPAQDSHSLVSRYGPGVALGAGALAAVEHIGEPAARMLYHNPEMGMVGASALGAGYGASKLANSWFSSQPYVKHLLDIAQGTGKPYLRGINPLIPAISDVASPRQ